MKFIDEISIEAKAGSGGNGFIGWRREKYTPQGGPFGGNGGNGGAVILVADLGVNTLVDLYFKPICQAGNGEDGGINGRFGSDGKDLICRVPVGTQVYHNENIVADLNQPNASWIAAKGGRGGRGNIVFKSSTNQAPNYAEEGQVGETLFFHLVLKSTADVGLVGIPNAGKSTLISKISRARPKIADYPFTTLIPNLGTVSIADGKNFVVADIPGLIPGAHLGKGLGIKFLKHIERTSVLVHLLDATQNHFSELDNELLLQQIINQFESIDYELQTFSENIALKKRLIVFSKCDVDVVKTAYIISKDYFLKRNIETMTISSHSDQGLEELKQRLYQLALESRFDNSQLQGVDLADKIYSYA